MDYYLDQNVYEHVLLKLGISIDQITAILRQRKIRLLLSEHNIHETVSCWKSGLPEKIEKGRQILKLQLSLQPVKLLFSIPLLIKHEIAPMIRNPSLGPFLDKASEAITRADLDRLLKVSLQEDHRVKLEDRWKRKEGERKDFEELRERQFSGSLKRVEPFEAFIQKNAVAMRSVTEKIVYRHATELNEKNRRKVAKMAAKRLKKFPVLRAAVRANMFLSYKLIRNEKVRHDVWDDLPHGITASYADVFITGDTELAKRLAFINPGLQVRDIAAFRSELVASP